MPLTLGQPRVGEKCLALGYSDFAVGPLAGNVGAWNFKLRAAQGVIEELHPKKRDESMIRFPSFRTTAFYEHGMSGGPLVNENGRVLGVVSSSYEKEHTTAYAAAVAAIAELSIDIEDLAGNVGTWSVKQLAEGGSLNLDRGTVTLDREPDGLVVTWQ
jgi:S1-C subfamily serine protease